jgi:hypothetical protein
MLEVIIEELRLCEYSGAYCGDTPQVMRLRAVLLRLLYAADPVNHMAIHQSAIEWAQARKAWYERDDRGRTEESREDPTIAG